MAPITHGMRRHPVYAVWNTMRQRCQNPRSHKYEIYGGRGIKLDPAWNTFIGFWTDMKATYQEGLTLERIDNDGPYSKKNCKWIAASAQARNTRYNRAIKTPAGKMLLCEAEEISGIGRQTLSWRVKKGWPISQLFLPPDYNHSNTRKDK